MAHRQQPPPGLVGQPGRQPTATGRRRRSLIADQPCHPLSGILPPQPIPDEGPRRTSVLGQQAVAVFRAAYNKVGLDPERAQFLNGNGAFATALRKVIEEHSMPVAAPKGGRIHAVRVPVDPTREWLEAVNAAGPDTPASCSVRKVGHLYPPQAGTVTDRDGHLVASFVQEVLTRLPRE